MACVTIAGQPSRQLPTSIDSECQADLCHRAACSTCAMLAWRLVSVRPTEGCRQGHGDAWSKQQVRHLTLSRRAPQRVSVWFSSLHCENSLSASDLSIWTVRCGESIVSQLHLSFRFVGTDTCNSDAPVQAGVSLGAAGLRRRLDQLQRLRLAKEESSSLHVFVVANCTTCSPRLEGVGSAAGPAWLRRGVWC